MSRHDFPAEEFEARRARLFVAMREAEVDWFLIFHPTSMHWLTGAEAKSYQAFQCLIADAACERLVMFTRQAERNEISAEALVDELHCWGVGGHSDPIDGLAGLAAQLGLTTARHVGMEVPAYYLHPHHYLKLTGLFAATVREYPNLVTALRLVKSPLEIAYLRQAARIADRSVQVLIAALRSGRSELEIAAEIYHEILSAGGDVPAVPPNLVSGPRASYSHGAPSERRLEPGDIGNAEYCVQFKRHTVSIGRQFVMGSPSGRLRVVMDTVRDAARAAIAAIHDGAQACMPYTAAENVLAAAGLDSHRVHTMGYAVASAFPPATGESLHLAPRSEEILRSGMVLSICPNVFIQDEGLGVRVVDNVLVTESGSEILSRTSSDLIVAE